MAAEASHQHLSRRWFSLRDRHPPMRSGETLQWGLSPRLAATVHTWRDFHKSLFERLVLDGCQSDTSDVELVGRRAAALHVVDAALPPRRYSSESESGIEVSSFGKSPRRSMSNGSLTMQELTTVMPDVPEKTRKALAKSPVVRQNVQLAEAQRTVNRHRSQRYWLEAASAAEHLWLDVSSSTAADGCYLSERECSHVGDKRRCAACHIVAHTGCFSVLSKMNLKCKQTFRNAPHRSRMAFVKEATAKEPAGRHHWLHRWQQDGRCRHCGKAFQQKLFGEKEVIAIACSWCKLAYHNKPSCFTMERVEEDCGRGQLRNVVVPPSWVLRVSDSVRRKKQSYGRRRKQSKSKSANQFVVKVPHAPSTQLECPLLVFVNPKSGGNKGAKLLNTLCWLLNPRQVFDINTMAGPRYALEMFRKLVPRLRMLICGGDGTVGWVLSTLDSLQWASYPPFAIVPLGTGNDLARTMGWGGAFTDEPMSELLSSIANCSVTAELDRWRLDVVPNAAAAPYATADADADPAEAHGLCDKLPLDVMNNYFSIGADAHVALQFHQSRSANPSIFNSRFKNRLMYGSLGTVDLFKRSCKTLSEYMTLECDGVDVTARLRESRFHCILFLNIPFYAGGTTPWGNPSGSVRELSSDGSATGSGGRLFSRSTPNDGKIEVLGFTTATLAAIQVGGKGERIAQCSSVRVVTQKPVPAQVDGEPCMLAPSIIWMQFHSKIPLLRRMQSPRAAASGVAPTTPHLLRRQQRPSRDTADAATYTSIFLKLPVAVVGRHDYERFRDEVERLKETMYEIGNIAVEAETELEMARSHIERLLKAHRALPYKPSANWRFLDYVTNSDEGIFRVARNRESLTTVSDVCSLDDCVLILDTAFPSVSQQPQPTVDAEAAGCSTHHGSTLYVRRHSRSQVPPRRPRRRRQSESLRFVLSSEHQETLL